MMLRVRCIASHRPEDLARLVALVNDPQGLGSAPALFAVRKEGRGGRGSGEAQAAWRTEESALARSAR
jgi:hypothetical protein